MSLTDSRKYVGLSFGISISASDCSDDLQQSPEDYVHRLLFQEASHILLEGGRLILGHDWRVGGIMDHLSSEASDLSAWRNASQPSSASIVSLTAWPDTPPDAADATAQRLIAANILEVHQATPENIDVSQVDLSSDLGKFCRIRALTALRKKLVELADLRICLGGPSHKPDRRLPGLVEEAVLTIEAGKPLYLSSAIGGVSRLMADALLQRRISEADKQHFATPESARALMQQFGAQYPYPAVEGPSILGDEHFDAHRYFQTRDLAQLATAAHLELNEYINLLTTAELNRATMLVTRGATRITQSRGVN